MFQYIIKRLFYMIPTIFVISFITFFLIQLPPGDFLNAYASKAALEGEVITKVEMERLREEYGFDQPILVQYGKWISKIITKGDFGHSFEQNMKVTAIIKSRMGMTILVSMMSLLFTYIVSIPISIYSATHQYSIGDYTATVIGFLGMATPNFILAIIMMYFAFKVFGTPLIGLNSPEYIGTAWSIGRILDLFKHLIIPIIVIGTAGTAGLIRQTRSQLLDQIKQQYVITARAKGMEERKLIFKYPIRSALLPMVSGIGYELVGIFSGSTITAIVLNLPTQGPVIYHALVVQDMYLAGGFLLITTVLTVFGTLVSDIGLAWLDPRIRFGNREN